MLLKEEHPVERAAFRALLAALLLSVSFYGYFVGSSIFNVIASKEAALEIARLQTAVGNLESEYFALSEDVSPERATLLGLAPVSQTEYVYQPGAVGSARGARSGL